MSWFENIMSIMDGINLEKHHALPWNFPDYLNIGCNRGAQ